MDRLDNVPEYKIAEMNYLAKRKLAPLGVRSSDPGGFEWRGCWKYRLLLKLWDWPEADANRNPINKVSWTVAAAAGTEWAKKVFQMRQRWEAVDLLWDQIYKTCRVYEDDPVAAWKAHEENSAQKQVLNEEQFTALHYTAPGTDLTRITQESSLGSAGSLEYPGEYLL